MDSFEISAQNSYNHGRKVTMVIFSYLTILPHCATNMSILGAIEEATDSKLESANFLDRFQQKHKFLVRYSLCHV